MRAALTCLLTVSLTGCGLEILTTTAIQGELAAQNANSAARALDYAKTSTTEMNVKHAIDLYKADKGSNPPTLEALVPQYLDTVPTKTDGTPYGYDPVSGVLTSGPVAAPVATGASDGEKQQQIAAAVQRYGRETGRYPVTLWSLVPNYLPQYPKTAGGQDFIYDPRSGGVFLPAGAVPGTPGAAAQQPGAQRGAVGGAGPMGEALSGISISNQLDSMSNAGSSSAQGYAGSSLGRSQAQHDAQQEQALQNLGM